MQQETRAKRRPAWMSDPENRRVALAALREGRPHKMYREISERLLRERNVQAEPIKINIFAHHNRGSVPAGEWLRRYLAQSLGEEDTTPVPYVPAPRKSRAKKALTTETRVSISASTASARADTDDAVSEVNKRAHKLAKNEEIDDALRRSGAQEHSDALQDQCKRILRAVTWGFRASEHNVDISYAQMSLKTKVGTETVITMVPGARISISVPASTADKKLSAEAKYYFALAELTKRALNTGALGEEQVLEKWEGGRIDLIVTVRGKTSLIAQKTLLPKPAEARTAD